MDPQAFELLMSRFDTLEQQNTETHNLLLAHIEKDESVHLVVDRHSTYWSIATWGVAGVFTSFGAWLFAKFS